MKKLLAFLVRHGETTLNASGCFRSWIDVPLDATGKKQALDAARFLWSQQVVRIFASPLIRTVNTAEVLALPKRIPIQQDRGLLPWRLGLFSGLDKDSNLDALNLFVQNPEVEIPNGESLQQFRWRTHGFFDEQLEKSKKALTVFFTHTSNITSLENYIGHNTEARPESGELVKPGGIVAVYEENGEYKIKPVFNGNKSEDD